MAERVSQSQRTTTPQPPAGESAPARLPLEPMDPQLTSIQPGGGIVIHLENAWGSVRRCYLRTFRRGYVARMERLRRGDHNPCCHPVLDPRDLKFHRNQPGYHWAREDDPFTWRDRLPFARVGLAELITFTFLFFGGAALLAWLAVVSSGVLAGVAWVAAIVLAALGLEVAWFFRNPHRPIPAGRGVVVSPADGTVVAVDELEFDEFVGGPAVMIGIFLSVFNVHINRVPVAARVIGLRYRPGKYLNALRPESAQLNERLEIRIEESVAPYRRMVVRQITGAIARRIVCWLKPGDELERGEQFGMIKLGSRTELVLPREAGLEIAVRIGNKVKAGSTVFARYTGQGDGGASANAGGGGGGA